MPPIQSSLFGFTPVIFEIYQLSGLSSDDYSNGFLNNDTLAVQEFRDYLDEVIQPLVTLFTDHTTGFFNRGMSACEFYIFHLKQSGVIPEFVEVICRKFRDDIHQLLTDENRTYFRPHVMDVLDLDRFLVSGLYILSNPAYFSDYRWKTICARTFEVIQEWLFQYSQLFDQMEGVTSLYDIKTFDMHGELTSIHTILSRIDMGDEIEQLLWLNQVYDSPISYMNDVVRPEIWSQFATLNHMDNYEVYTWSEVLAVQRGDRTHPDNWSDSEDDDDNNDDDDVVEEEDDDDDESL